MREIKFRAWDGANMQYQLLLHGDKWALSWRDWEDAIFFSGPVMQFTGLKDKNGKEIWEGDIVEDGVGKSVVFWSDIDGWHLGFQSIPVHLWPKILEKQTSGRVRWYIVRMESHRQHLRNSRNFSAMMPHCKNCDHLGVLHNWKVRRLWGHCTYPKCDCVHYVPDTPLPKPPTSIIGRLRRRQ